MDTELPDCAWSSLWFRGIPTQLRCFVGVDCCQGQRVTVDLEILPVQRSFSLACAKAASVSNGFSLRPALQS
jgi:hypothetical protein